MEAHEVAWYLFSLCLSLAMSYRGWAKRSLSISGAVAACFIGAAHMAAGWPYGATLIMFYLSSSKLTRLQQQRKAAMEADFKADGQRNAVQVLANSAAACVLVAACAVACQPTSVAVVTPNTRHALLAAFLGHYCCCCGDTWASELGVLSSRAPRLITTLREVPPGTNGGVSGMGTAASAVAGAFIAATFWAASQASRAWQSCVCTGEVVPWVCELSSLVPVCVLCALCGSAVDSLLGATLQFSGIRSACGRVTNRPGPGVKRICGRHLLSNDAVNALAAASTSLFAGAVLAACMESKKEVHGVVQVLVPDGGLEIPS